MTRALRLFIILAGAAPLAGQTWGARPPRVLSRSEPEYTEEARRAGVNTIILASLVVDEQGKPQDIRIVRGAGFGLDESAIRALQTWRFEPALKEGKAYRATTHIEIHLLTPDRAHHGQTVRLDFGLGPGVERPRLVSGEIPANPDPPTDASLRVRFRVGSDGRPRDFEIFDTNNRQWTHHALQAMELWRFRPAMRKGHAEEVYGVLDLTTNSQAQENRPVLRRVAAGLGRAEPQDSSLAAPTVISPPAHAMFDGRPRGVTCKWEPSQGAASYLLEWDYMDGDAWHAELAELHEAPRRWMARRRAWTSAAR